MSCLHYDKDMSPMSCPLFINLDLLIKLNMKVSREAAFIATKILAAFDPDHLKAKQMDKID